MALIFGAASVALVASPATAAPVVGTDVTYTTDADFDQGLLVNVNHDAPNNNQLQLNTESGTFPFIWVALSQRCTITKVNTETGEILGEYRTISDGAACRESSRTTVAVDGSVWVGHRGPGGVTHVGLAELNECIDRNGNGTIETSSGYDDVLAWPGAGSVLADAADECILHHIDTAAAGLIGDSRHVSIDADNDLWIGDFSGGRRFARFDGATGALEMGPRGFGCGGYGGLVDNNGVVWSSNGGGVGLLRWDPNAPDSATNPRCVAVPVYGVAIDNNGSVWVSSGTQIRKVSSDGTTVEGPFSHGAPSVQGLAVDGNGDVWTSSSLSCAVNCTVGHLKNDGTFVGNVSTPPGGTGVAIDAAGKPWVVNRSDNSAARIDAAAGPLGCGGTGCGDGTQVGQVDLVVDFPATTTRPAPLPYNYSDMTGAQLFNNTAPQGTWTIVQDGGVAGTNWGRVSWNTEPQGQVPAGATLLVEARTADSEAGLGAQPYAAVGNGAAFDRVGRFIQVRVTMRPNDEDASPVLSDLRITTAEFMTGRAFGLSASLPLVPIAPRPDTGPIATNEAGTVAPPCVASLPGGLVTAHVLCASVTTAVNPGKSTATASLKDARVALPLIPGVQIGAVQVSSESTCAGSTGSTTVASLKIGGIPVPIPLSPPPNTGVSLLGITVVLNQQLPVAGADQGLTVNGARVIIPGLADVIVASATSDMHNCP